MVAKRKEEVPIYNRLAALRAERGMSRAELAAAVGINPQSVGFIERGDYGPSLELALRLSRVFGLPVEALFSLEPLPALSLQVYGKEEE
ncbi:helix-turn-helix transcriptional regulator [Deinococcus wulumuqiensis]|uniref:Transcriptional regulator n=1 Tax=Deinococcus wulumuqiensis TaxID=980427 RepID=A0A345IHT7_9DEIO|nr:helix-turn-helix transcriptional regulator [Deinococcus wulumuqiensis]AXG99259.1 transcriptional regulator [Deinococcus wulumuqiensis]QII21625.1 helix-turn-helix transcriptional regulator [Deinococcus wulumuqiensis R12]GGI90365.1 transcriptional regulator [Deinococcus wulumuqiensis]GGP30755.1 transcriptional regulator [Deinococcus wulumuqiensis]